MPASFLDIIQWNEPILSASIFFALLFFITALSQYTLVTLVTCFSIPILTTTLFLQIIYFFKSTILGTPLINPFSSWLSIEITFSEDFVILVSNSLFEVLRQILILLRKIILVDDIATSTKALVFLFALHNIGRCFSTYSILYIGVLLLFTFPRIISYVKENETSVNGLKYGSATENWLTILFTKMSSFLGRMKGSEIEKDVKRE